MRIPSVAEYEETIERARALHRSDRRVEARDLLREAIRLGERIFENDQIGLVEALSLLASAIDNDTQGGPGCEEELAIHQRILDITEATCAADDPRTAKALYTVGLDLWVLKRHAEALDCVTRAFDIATRTHGDTHYFVSQVRGSLGSLLTEMGHLAEGIPLLRQEAAIADAQTSSASRMIAHWFLGASLLQAERWDEAILSFETSLELAEARPQGEGRQAEQLRTWLDEARAGRQRPR